MVEPSALRKEVLSTRDGLDPHLRGRLSRRVCNNLFEIDAYRHSVCPMLYVSFRSEVETHALIKERIGRGQKVAVPLTDMAHRQLRSYLIADFYKDLAPGAYGILEPLVESCVPVDPAEIDVIIVPGSVFDTGCGRYGYGGGYYDRFLSESAPQAVRIALAFQLQMRDKIQLLPHDQRMDYVVTEERIYSCCRQ